MKRHRRILFLLRRPLSTSPDQFPSDTLLAGHARCRSPHLGRARREARQTLSRQTGHFLGGASSLFPSAFRSSHLSHHAPSARPHPGHPCRPAPALPPGRTWSFSIRRRRHHHHSHHHLRHCVLAARRLGPAAEACLLDNTLLADRVTVLRAWLAANPGIMEEEPPAELVGRYSG